MPSTSHTSKNYGLKGGELDSYDLLLKAIPRLLGAEEARSYRDTILPAPTDDCPDTLPEAGL